MARASLSMCACRKDSESIHYRHCQCKLFVHDIQAACDMLKAEQLNCQQPVDLVNWGADLRKCTFFLL